MTTVKIFGAIFILFSPAAAAYVLTESLRAAAAARAAIRRGLKLMQSEISVRLTPIPELTERLAECSETPFRDFMSELHFNLSGLGECEFTEIWDKSLAVIKLAPDEMSVLKDLGRSIGRYDAEEQCAALRYAEERFDDFAARAEQRRSADSRIRAAAALSAGIIIILILF